ncbi:transposase [Rhizobium straminoryzae]|uniref:transposase n=1 Tax=Rhizobium straminoryzae TaxID=1387186 RepID=UPI00319E69A4
MCRTPDAAGQQRHVTAGGSPRIGDRNEDLNVTGIHDFVFRRGQTYGTIVCDLERRRPVTLLPDRALDASRTWLAEHPSVSIVAHDRGGGCGEAMAKVLPDSAQVADRWHLMENSSRAFLDAVGKSMWQIRHPVGSNVVDPRLLTSAEKLQSEGYPRRQKTNEAVRALLKIAGCLVSTAAGRKGHGTFWHFGVR